MTRRRKTTSKPCKFSRHKRGVVGKCRDEERGEEEEDGKKKREEGGES